MLWYHKQHIPGNDVFKVGFLCSSSELVIILYCSKMFYIVSTILWCPHFPHRLQCDINKEVSFIEHG